MIKHLVNKYLPFRRCLIILVAYGMAYFVVSRMAFSWSLALGCSGFYFVPPTNSFNYYAHATATVFFYPAIQVDLLVGTGKSPGKEPLMRLSQ
jgi:hypothetical protein